MYTVAEFSVTSGTAWYDISVIPPGSGSCSSYEACAELTGKTGYNKPMSIVPTVASGSTATSSCKSLTCESAECSDAYLYPSDDTKTHSCPDSTTFVVTFCPSGSDSAASSTASSTASSSASASSTPSSTTATPSTSTAAASVTVSLSEVASDYDSATVAAAVTTSATSTSSASTTSTTSTSTSTTSTTSTSSGSAASYSSATVNASFVYTGAYAGNYEGTYGAITAPKACTTETVSVNDPVGPFAEESTLVFRGPMNIYNIAVFNGSTTSGDWEMVASWDAETNSSDNMIFMNNLNVDYSGDYKSPQGFSSADALSSVDEPVNFGGWLADASSPSTVGGGPSISTGAEINIMANTSCDSDSGCNGYYDSRGYHGYGGGKKMFVTKVMMPTADAVNLPAIWLLNAQVVRSNQYGCNCRGSGSVGGCGEFDIAEVIETNTAQDKVSTHIYALEGTYPSSGDNWAARPSTSAVTYITIIDNSNNGTIKILQIGGDDFNFSASAVSADQVTTWLDASVSNLLS